MGFEIIWFSGKHDLVVLVSCGYRCSILDSSLDGFPLFLPTTSSKFIICAQMQPQNLIQLGSCNGYIIYGWWKLDFKLQYMPTAH